MDVLHRIETLLRRAEGPLAPDRIRKLLHPTIGDDALRDAIDHYARLGFVTVGSRGVMWTLNVDPGLWGAVREWESR